MGARRTLLDNPYALPHTSAASRSMRVSLSPSDVTDDLVAALRAGECLAARIGEDTIEVGFPWQLLDATEHAEHQARTELRFFLRAWLAGHPGVEAIVLT